MTIAQQMEATGNRSTGFDYMRLILALMVMVRHAFDISYTRPVADRMWPIWSAPATALILPMFFALSGFLVAGSLRRSPTLVVFGGLRIIRIMPALAVEVLLSAMILGPIVTTASLGDYVSSPLFRLYLLNVIGDIHYHLPGVFLSNPMPGIVNGQLWTVPWELACYVTLVGLAAFGVVRRRFVFLGLIGLGCMAAMAFQAWRGIGPIIGAYGVHSPVLLLSFLSGVAIHAFRDRLPWGPRLIVVLVVVGWSLLEIPGGQFVAPLPVAYLTVALGLTNPPKLAILRGADYSYGIFLYGFAIQQTVAWLGPWTHRGWINLAISVPVATLVAAASWTFVEEPALALRRILPRIRIWPLRRADAVDSAKS
jgi:peptidoglycan/LPS O-acetylase OafA/YrhL